MKPFTFKLIAACALSLRTAGAFAHDGHNMEGSHWHATDVGGFVALGLAVVVAIWLSRGGR